MFVASAGQNGFLLAQFWGVYSQESMRMKQAMQQVAVGKNIAKNVYVSLPYHRLVADTIAVPSGLIETQVTLSQSRSRKKGPVDKFSFLQFLKHATKRNYEKEKKAAHSRI